MTTDIIIQTPTQKEYKIYTTPTPATTTGQTKFNWLRRQIHQKFWVTDELWRDEQLIIHIDQDIDLEDIHKQLYSLPEAAP